MRHIARLVDPAGAVTREWLTDNPALAMTADRNFPPGWRVEIEAEGLKPVLPWPPDREVATWTETR